MYLISKLKKSAYVYEPMRPSLYNNEKSFKAPNPNDVDAYLKYHLEVNTKKINKRVICQTLGLQGIQKYLQEEYIEAIQLFEKQYQLAETEKLDVYMASSVLNLGVVYKKVGKLRKAYAAFIYSFRISKLPYNGLPVCSMNLAIVLQTIGQVSAALTLYKFYYKWYSSRIPYCLSHTIKSLFGIMDCLLEYDEVSEALETVEKLIDQVRHKQAIADSHPEIIDEILQEEDLVMDVYNEETNKKSLKYLLMSIFRRN